MRTFSNNFFLEMSSFLVFCRSLHAAYPIAKLTGGGRLKSTVFSAIAQDNYIPCFITPLIYIRHICRCLGLNAIQPYSDNGIGNVSNLRQDWRKELIVRNFNMNSNNPMVTFGYD